MTVEGLNGQVELYEHCVRIKRKGCLGVLFQLQYGLKGDKDILLDSLSGVQLKDAGFSSGYIRFIFAGANEPRGGVTVADKDENAIEFGLGKQKAFEALRDAIYQLRVRAQQVASGAIPASQPFDLSIFAIPDASPAKKSRGKGCLAFLLLGFGLLVLISLNSPVSNEAPRRSGSTPEKLAAKEAAERERQLIEAERSARKRDAERERATDEDSARPAEPGGDSSGAPVAYQTDFSWKSAKLGRCRMIVISPSDTTEARVKVLGSQLRRELQRSQETWVWIYDEFKAVQLEADRSPTGILPESALERIYRHLVASYIHEDAIKPDEFFFSSRSEPTLGKYRWRRILYSSTGPEPATVMPDATILGPDIRELKTAVSGLSIPQDHSGAGDQSLSYKPDKLEVHPEFRTWTDASGEHKTEARFKGMAFGKVKLLKRSGEEVVIPLDKLSDEDQAWIKRRK